MDQQNPGATQAPSLSKISSQEVVLDSENLIWDADRVGVYISEYKGTPVAVKKFIKAHSNRAIIDPIDEGRLQFSIAHPHILTLYGYVDDAAYTGLVMELCAGSMGDFLEHKDMEGTQAVRDSMIIDVAKGLVYLHEVCRILHLDIKHDNILLVETTKNQYTAKISDFGFSKRLQPDVDKYYLNNNIGTKAWAAPEVFLYSLEHHGMIYSAKCDVFGLGHLIHLLTRDKVIDPLPAGFDIPQIVNGMVSNMTLDKTYSNEPTRTLIRFCLQLNPGNRATSKQVLEQLEKNKTLFESADAPKGPQ